MTEIEMILEMAEMQKKLDEALLEKGKTLRLIDSFDKYRTVLALIDEIGELTHELKAEWCWWKQTQAPVNTEKLLEELVDCWHFGLSLDNHSDYEIEYHRAWLKLPRGNTFIAKKLNNVIENAMLERLVTPPLYTLTYALGFSMEQVYRGYVVKNAENYKRIESGY